MNNDRFCSMNLEIYLSLLLLAFRLFLTTLASFKWNLRAKCASDNYKKVSMNSNQKENVVVSYTEVIVECFLGFRARNVTTTLYVCK